MKKIKSFDDVRLAAIQVHGTISTILVGTPNQEDMNELNDNWMDGLYIEDNSEILDGFPDEPGFYAATLELWFQQGYFEGYPADGESSVFVKLSNLRRLEVHDPGA